MGGFPPRVAAIAAPAHADEATLGDFWRSAASVATATVHAPADRALRKVGLGFDPFLGCYDADDSSSQSLSERACPVAKRNYFSYDTLPAANGRSATYVNVEAQGLSRGQVGTVLRSLRAVR